MILIAYDTILGVIDYFIDEEERIAHQRCRFHIMQDLDSFLSVHGERRGKDQILYSRLKYILHARTLKTLIERLNMFRKHRSTSSHPASTRRS